MKQEIGGLHDLKNVRVKKLPFEKEKSGKSHQIVAQDCGETLEQESSQKNKVKNMHRFRQLRRRRQEHLSG